MNRSQMLKYRNVSAVLWFVSFVATIMTAFAGVNEYLPDSERMEVFGAFRDGTLTAVIAIVAILLNFGNSVLREHATVKAHQADVEKSRIMAEALSGIGNKIDHNHNALMTKLDGRNLRE